jgi:hypothetical protein
MMTEKLSSRTLVLSFMTVLLFLIVVLGSCATSPRFPDASAPAGEFAALDGGGRMYFAADVQSFRPILEKARLEGFPIGEAGEILDRTGSVAGAVYPAGEEAAGSGKTWLVAAKGTYPRGLASLSMAFSSAWKKTKSPGGKKYWRSKNQTLSVYLERNYALVSDGDPLARNVPVTVPETFAHYRTGSLFSLWLDDAGVFVSRFLENLPIPIQAPVDRIIFAVYPEGREPGGEGDIPLYYGIFRMEAPSVNEAKALASMIRLLSRADPDSLDKAAAMLFGNPAEVDGSALILKIGPLDAGAFALLFTMFSVH